MARNKSNNQEPTATTHSTEDSPGAPRVAEENAPAPETTTSAAPQPNLCRCGCGNTTKRNWYPSHDAVVKGQINRLAKGKVSAADLSESVRVLIGSADPVLAKLVPSGLALEDLPGLLEPKVQGPAG